MKPNWKDAPEWAEWMAMDSDLSWYWYEDAPWRSSFKDEWACEGRHERAYSDSWKTSKEPRP